jgi:hypothetical protein
MTLFKSVEQNNRFKKHRFLNLLNKITDLKSVSKRKKIKFARKNLKGIFA